ncbi:MAG: hypothetical protein V1897_11295 [Pseudomonadota bacterium]
MSPDHFFQAQIFQEIFHKLLELCNESYLVGGTVRDALLGRSTISDFDIAVDGDGYELARLLAGSLSINATFVPLDKVRRVGRVVAPMSPISVIDVSTFKGPTISDDLCARDFTINSMAAHLWDILAGRFSEAIIDPVGGRDDLAGHTIRISSETSFESDPLRMIRAFRFEAQLNFGIDRGTLLQIKNMAHTIELVSGERMRDELTVILSSENSHSIVSEMAEFGLLWSMFPALIPTLGFEQNRFHHLDVWRHTLSTLKNLESIIAHLPEILGDLSETVLSYLNEQLVPGRKRMWLLKLAVLLHDSGKPASLTIDDQGRRRFFGHEKISGSIASAVGGSIKLASREVSALSLWVEGHMRTSILCLEDASQRSMMRFCRDFGRDLIGLALLHLADLSASQGPARSSNEFRQSILGVRRILDILAEQERMPSRPLLNGDELMSEFGLQQGPRLGAILRWLTTEQSLGAIKNKDQASEAVRRYLSMSEAELLKNK